MSKGKGSNPFFRNDGLVSLGPLGGNGDLPDTVQMPPAQKPGSGKMPVPDDSGKSLHVFEEPSQPAKESRPTRSQADSQAVQEWITRYRAANLQGKAAAGYLYVIAQQMLGKNIDVDTYCEYRNGFLRACGDPQDPIEVLMVEQLLLAHHSIGRLHCQSALAQHPDLAVAFSNAAARLAGELRRTAVALATYREKSRPTFNEAPGVAGRIAPEPQQEPERRSQKKQSGSKQGSNGVVPQCLRERMQPPIPAGSRRAAATGPNGEG